MIEKSYVCADCGYFVSVEFFPSQIVNVSDFARKTCLAAFFCDFRVNFWQTLRHAPQNQLDILEIRMQEAHKSSTYTIVALNTPQISAYP